MGWHGLANPSLIILRVCFNEVCKAQASSLSDTESDDACVNAGLIGNSDKIVNEFLDIKFCGC